MIALTRVLRRPRNQYIDDRTDVDHAAEDEHSDDDAEDPDASEAQIRQQDERDFKMPEIYGGHQARLVSDARYRIPPGLLSPPDTSRPSTSPPPKIPLFLPDSRDPTPAFDLPRGLTPMSIPASSRQSTPFVSSAPQASSSRSANRLFLPDSRDPTPAYSLPRGFTPATMPSFSPAPEASSSLNPPFSPDSRDPWPSTHSFSPAPSVAPSASTPRPSRSRPSSPDLQPTNKRARLHKGKSRADVNPFLDLAASDSEDGDDEDDNDDDIQMDAADISFVDDTPLPEDIVRPSVRLPEDPAADTDMLEQLANDYERRVAAGGYDTDPDDESTDDDYVELNNVEPDASLRLAVANAVYEVMPINREKHPASFLPLGTWIVLQNQHKGRSALVIAPTAVVAERVPRQPSKDPCEIITDLDPPLFKHTYTESRAKPSLDQLLPFQLSKLPQLRQYIDFPIAIGTWIRLKGKKHNGRLALVLSRDECVVQKLAPRPVPDPVQGDGKQGWVYDEKEEAKKRKKEKKREKHRKASKRPAPPADDPCEILANIKPYLLKKNYNSVFPSPDEILAFESSVYGHAPGLFYRRLSSAPAAGDRVIVVDLKDVEEFIAEDATDNSIVSGTVCWVLGWLPNIPVHWEGKFIGTAPSLRVCRRDPATLPLSQNDRGRWLEPTQVRRHAISCPPTLYPLDRVSVRGPQGVAAGTNYASYVGCIKEIHHNFVVVHCILGEANPNLQIHAELRELRRDFRDGDSIVVFAGEHKGRKGFIIGSRDSVGGIMEVFDNAFSGPPGEIPRAQTFRVRAAHINFDLERAPEAGDYTRRVPIATSQADAPLTLAPTLSTRKLEERVESLEHPGKRFEGIQVRVVGATRGKSLFKGKAGLVIGDLDSEERRQRLNPQYLGKRKHVRGDTDGIEVTIREAVTGVEFTVPIEQLVHDATSLPLAQVQYLPNKILFSSRQAPAPSPPPRAVTPPQDVLVGDSAWGIDPVALFESFRIPGESTGEWLCSATVTNKRVDVLLDVKAFTRTAQMKLSAAAEKMHGYIRVVGFEEPISPSSIKTKKLTVFRIGPHDGTQLARDTFPAHCLQPLRHNSDGSSISTVAQRVIILGADVEDLQAAVGRYGKTRPDIPQHHGEHVVTVQVEGSSVPSVFHVLHLGRALNVAVSLPSGDFPPTDFPPLQLDTQ
ncbi:hypothetical protein FB451DRAFT_1419061 [Mycena latifolia]|nr:hypothetical protein FB451DRAFT_1419061 [Mycena latifolia]